MTLETPLVDLYRRRKPQREARERLHLETVRDALFHLPHRYTAFDQITRLADADAGETQAFFVRIARISSRRTRKRGLTITEAIVEDESGSLRAVWFNQPYLPKMFPKGTELLLHGKVDYKTSGLQITSPKCEKGRLDDVDTLEGHITPVYPVSAGISSVTLQKLIERCLPFARLLSETLPEDLCTRQSLLPLPEAISVLHAPDSQETLERARERMAFEELYELQLSALTRRERWKQGGGISLSLSEETRNIVLSSLPFSLTGAQSRVIQECLEDLGHPTPMHRLLQGDVGAGKTLVAALLLVATAESSMQGALMAPTDLLAKQHAQTLARTLLPALRTNPEWQLGLYTRTAQQIYHADTETFEDVPQETFLEELASGSVDLVVGTHALIQASVAFSQLGLVVIDEQHRFGVKQREQLRRRSHAETIPHVLAMSATPIPRSLALAVYADLDVSTIDELPPGRTPITTRIVSPKGAPMAEQFLRQEIERGRQAFVVCPLIQPSDDPSFAKLASAETTFKRLSEGPLSGIRCALLHGKLAQEEKDAVMNAFSRGEIDVLVSTTVVEVGVDVPNATVMAIYGAERFGLAQLHQLRGRVGRGEYASTCFAFVTQARSVAERLRAFETTTDGFELAQRDLEQRGPGQLSGIAQSGLPDLRMASLMDTQLLERAQQEARERVSANKPTQPAT